ncbi:flavin reductase family protein [Alkalicoccus daliensis]|uniref:NADH-FMN oxidoreductase RutF, flavin reductase (DIM6/NTAB) family n=1 Tax=Alkalicoccus daliensis TaxID=745820 RepID=A0A1H0HS62_9BACI|nr:flavin reductase family protein [Alkalicoccus daliensis]SDO21977.1 NADH-FMN oxidoreductase RutF, flavin reductase (DIM6/NTAB) family [Alkalicoccus daliensis]
MDSNQSRDKYSQIYGLRSRGVFFVSTSDDKRAHFHFGCWTTQCSHHPPRMLTCFPKEFEGTEIVKNSGRWALSLAAADQEEFHDKFFSGNQSIQEIGEEHFIYAETGTPILKDAVAYFDCKVHSLIDNGDFVIAVGDIVDAKALHPDKKNLNVEYLSAEREEDYMTGPLTLPFKGFNL